MRYKQLVLAFIIFLSCASVYGQELAATVNVQTSKIENQIDTKIFTQFQKQLKDFVNQRKWTNDVYAPVEKIECNFFITISKVADDNASFSASLQVQSSRPVYGTNLKAAMLSIQDDNFNFTYSLNQALDYTDNEALSNLTSVLAYYVYIILAYDYDSFSLKGGSDYLQRAQNVLNNN